MIAGLCIVATEVEDKADLLKNDRSSASKAGKELPHMCGGQPQTFLNLPVDRSACVRVLKDCPGDAAGT